MRSPRVINIALVFVYMGLLILGGVIYSPASASAEAKKILKIGCVVDMSGSLAAFGAKNKAAVELAAEHINASPKYNFKIETVWIDNEGKIPVAINVAERMVLVDKIDVINGPMSSGTAVALAPTVKQHKIAMLVPVAKADNVTAEGGGYIFQPGGMSKGFIRWMADVVVDKVKPKKVAFVYETTEVGLSQTEQGAKRLEEAKIEITSKIPAAIDLVDYHPVASKLKAQATDLIWVCIRYPSIMKLARALNEVGAKQKYICAGYWDSSLFTEAPELFDGFLALEFFWLENPDPQVQNFIKSFQGKYGRTPEKWEAMSYDTAWIIAEAARIGGANREGILKGIPQVNFKGVSGQLRFDTQGNPINPPYYLYQYQTSMKKFVLFAKQ